jgi:conjugal transfer pilus assembly protein TraD
MSNDSSTKSNSGASDLFSHLILGFTDILRMGIDGGTKSLAQSLKGGRFKGKKENSYQRLNASMLEMDRTSLDENHLGWSVNYDMPYPFSYFDPSKNTFIVGASGWGKTNLINLLQENCLKKGQAIIFIDPKGSAESIKYFKQLCRFYKKKYYIFSEFDKEATSFNPISDMTISQQVTSIMRSFDWGEKPNVYYLNQSTRALREVLEKLSSSKKEFDLHDVLKKLKTDFDKEETSGLITQLELILKSDFGPRFRKSLDGARPSMTMKRAWKEKACIYIGCSTQGYAELAKTVGKIFVSEAMNLSYSIGKEFDDSHKAMEQSLGLFIDEAGSVLFPNFLDLVNKCRSSGINTYTAVQSYSDMKMVGGSETFMEQLCESYSSWFIQRQTNSDNAEKLASSIGTYLSQKTTSATEAGSESGRGTIREGYEYFCHPDMIKSINIGQSILLTHGPKDIQLLNLRDARNSKAFQAVPIISKDEPMAKVKKSIKGDKSIRRGTNA